MGKRTCIIFTEKICCFFADVIYPLSLTILGYFIINRRTEHPLYLITFALYIACGVYKYKSSNRWKLKLFQDMSKNALTSIFYLFFLMKISGSFDSNVLGSAFTIIAFSILLMIIFVLISFEERIFGKIVYFIYPLFFAVFSVLTFLHINTIMVFVFSVLIVGSITCWGYFLQHLKSW